MDINQENKSVNLEKLLTDLGNVEISSDNLLEVCLKGMKIVEGFPKLKGEEKKKLVIQSIEVLLQKSGVDNNLASLLPYFIDNIISVEKGELKISAEKTVLGCLKFCCK